MRMHEEWIALIAEGGAETGILSVLLDNNYLKFTWEDLLNNDILRSRSAIRFQRLYLDRAMKKKVHIYRILDSRTEIFKLSEAYRKRVSAIDSLYTRPEIEMLYVINGGQYDSFKKANIKPSQYCKQFLNLPKGNIKSKDYVIQYWSKQPENIVRTIKQYSQLSGDPFEQTLAAIIR